VIHGQLRKELGSILRELAQQKECRVEEGHLKMDHVHMLISIPPKYLVSHVVGFIKGKSAIHIARTYMGRKQNFVGQHFWARGYYVSTVGRDEATVRDYIRQQEKVDERLDQPEMFK
jgi:putative transposase